VSKSEHINADGWAPRARRAPSPNHDRRPDAAVVDLLVIHHISLPAGRFSGDAVERLGGAHQLLQRLGVVAACG
jgi:hypothetical protein